MLRKLLCFSSLLILIIAFASSFGITGCSKTTTQTDTVVVVKTDTFKIQEKDTTLTTAILTANSWKAQYDRASAGSNTYFYERGGSSNTINLDNDYITFSSNNTGVYTNNLGVQTTFTWQFTDATNTSIVWIWNLPTPVTVTWENIGYDDNAIHYTEYYTINGIFSLSSEVRIPK